MDAAGQETCAAELRAMGLRAQVRVVLCRAGEPCIVRVLGACGCESRIGLAKPLADQVLVEVAPAQ